MEAHLFLATWPLFARKGSYLSSNLSMKFLFYHNSFIYPIYFLRQLSFEVPWILSGSGVDRIFCEGYNLKMREARKKGDGRAKARPKEKDRTELKF